MEWETLIHLHKDSDYRRKDSDPTEISLVKGYEHYYFFFLYAFIERRNIEQETLPQ